MLIDSDILIDFARNETKAVEFLEEALRKDVTKISAVSHMELIVGCRNKRELNALDGFVGRFEIIHLSSDISTQATDLLRRYRSSHGLMIPDAAPATTARTVSTHRSKTCTCIPLWPTSGGSCRHDDTPRGGGNLRRRQGNRRAGAAGLVRKSGSTHVRLRHPESREHRLARRVSDLARAGADVGRAGRQGLAEYDCDHGLCNSHLLRELVFLWEEQSQKWAKSMIDHLLAIKDAVATAGASGLNALPPADQERFLDTYERIVQAGYTQNPLAPQHGPKRRGRRKQSKARNLLDRFRDHPDEILAFMRDFAVPFDNNQSERDLRMMKLRQKISGAFRSFDALVNFCRIRGYVSTARKNGVNALDALQRVFCGYPFVPTINTS